MSKMPRHWAMFQTNTATALAIDTRHVIAIGGNRGADITQIYLRTGESFLVRGDFETIRDEIFDDYARCRRDRDGK